MARTLLVSVWRAPTEVDCIDDRGGGARVTDECMTFDEYEYVAMVEAQNATLRHEVERLRALVVEALAKGPERRCPWCWVVASRGRHDPACRAVAMLAAVSDLTRLPEESR